MLLLNADQSQALHALKRTRDLRMLREQMAAAFPDVAARAGERLEALVELGVQRGANWGLQHLVCVARYLACWCMLGAEFEQKPEHAWARELLASGRQPGPKVFQLCRRTRETLVQPAAGQMPAASFETAIGQLDAALLRAGRIGALLPSAPPTLGDPCDLDALDLRALEPASQRYVFEQGQWQRSAAALPAPLTVQPSPDGPALPERIHVLAPAKLRLRTRHTHTCDEHTHPLLAHKSALGLMQWRGRQAAEVLLPLLPPPAASAAQGIAVEGTPAFSEITAAGCGLRDSGASFGEQACQLAVYPSEQHLLAWRREASSPARARIERDGQALDASRWIAGLAELDRQLADSLARLSTAWERESGVTNGRMQAEPQVMVGTAALSWGWAAGAELAQAPHYRVAGLLDIVACELRLRLGGDFALAGSQSRLALHCSGSEKLQVAFDRRDATLDVPGTIKPAQCAIRQPFVLHVESLAPADQPALLDLAGPVAGAVVGTCGLRARLDAPGLEWFCELAIEAVSARFVVGDALMGRTTVVRPLLPAMKLVSWRLG